MTTSKTIPIYIISGLKDLIKLDAINVEEAKSAQQRVLIFEYSKHDVKLAPNYLQSVLESGGCCLVIRIWKGGSRWWNLNRANDVDALAAAEIEGYRLARKALGTRIPKLLHVSTKKGELSWAVFEYVGKKSTRFAEKRVIYDQYWTESMIKVRDEFGFPEPHPRWGRVPVEDCLSYTKRVLYQVTIPLHKCIFEHEEFAGKSEIFHLCGNMGGNPGYTYKGMLREYRKAQLAMEESLQSLSTSDQRSERSLYALRKCIDLLEKEVINKIPHVLLHMDCQPQNLVFARTQNNDDPWLISSVLDWEDSAYGDPRFELLLLGRKVSKVVCLQHKGTESPLIQYCFAGLCKSRTGCTDMESLSGPIFKLTPRIHRPLASA